MPVDTTRLGVPPLEGIKVLVVEDDVLIGLDLVTFLEGLGCSVRGPITNVRDAMDAISEELPDVATLDFNLRADETSGEIARILHRLSRPFVYVTAESRELGRSDLPSAPIIEKPFQPQRLHDILVNLL